MKNSKLTVAQMFAMLNENEAGAMVDDVCRKHKVSSPSYYKIKSK